MELPTEYPTWKAIARKVRESYELFKSIDPLVTRLAWLFAIFGGLSTLIGFGIAGIALQKAAADYVAGGSLTLTTVYIAAGGYIVYSFASQGLRALWRWRGALINEEYKRRLDVMYVEKVMSLDVGRLMDPDFIKVKETAENRGKESMKELLGSVTNLIGSLSGALAAFAVALALDPVLILLGIIPIAPALLERFYLDKKERRMWEEQILHRRHRQAYEEVLTARSHVVQTRLFRATAYFLGEFRRYFDILMDFQRRFRALQLISNVGIAGITALVAAAAAIYLGHRVISGSIDLFGLMLLIGSMQTFGSSINTFVYATATLKTESLDHEYHRLFMEMMPLIDETDAGDITFKAAPGIELRQVSFVYPRQGSRMALDRVTLSIPPRQKVALVGRNGSGKTTVARLLSKVYLPSDGGVYFGGNDTKDVTQASLLKSVLYVTQESVVPEVTIREAITAERTEDVDKERLAHAASIVDLDSFVKGLPKRFETPIGEWWPGGAGFSQGQLQRIKLAGALYRLSKDVRCAIFDEPMSHCDVETREQFYSSLKNVSEATVIVIAHDPLYLHHFERVIVLDEGRVIDDIVGISAINAYKSVLAESISGDHD